MIHEVIIYTCDNCKKIYKDHPGKCECENSLRNQEQIGPFKILDTVSNGLFKVQCLLCGMVKEIHRSNLRRQVSCGCKPKTIEILQFTETQFRYRCRKCGASKLSSFPVDQWCCVEDE